MSYENWTDYYEAHISEWMTLAELREEVGKLDGSGGGSPMLLLIHAMHLLDEKEKQS